mgnify:CR=1 FL=1
MDSERVKEILQSTAMVQVGYNGIPVYIEEIDEVNKTAKVFPLDNMDHVQYVDIEGLHEI